MAASHIETDRGLTTRMFVTGLLLVTLWVGVSFILFAVGVQWPVVMLIMFAAIFSQYWFSGQIALYSMRARIVTPEEEPQLHAMVDRLCALAGMPKPQVGVADLDVPNAFATGRSPKAAVVVVTRGIQSRLPDEELEAVLAHELSHVAHRDVAVMTIASSIGMVAGLVGRMALWGAMFSGGGRNNDEENFFLVEIATLLVSIAIYFVSYLLTLSLSRYRELSADRSGAILIGKPSVLASALVRITGDMSRIPTQDLRKSEGMNAFFFAPAFTKGSAAALLSTHPTLQRRLDQLAQLERDLNG